jgi:hypothetical protein
MSLQRNAKLMLFALVLIYLALMIAGESNVSIAFHIPHDSTAVNFVAQHSWAIRWGSFCEFISAIPLGIFMAITIGRLRISGIRSAGEQIAALGGIATPMMIVGSALATWSLTRPGVAAATGAVETLQSLGFDGGGPGFAVFLGLFVAGASLVAGVDKRFPHWLIWLGVVVAAAGELSSFALLNFNAGYFIPVARFLSVVWMCCLALELPPVFALREGGSGIQGRVSETLAGISTLRVDGKE